MMSEVRIMLKWDANMNTTTITIDNGGNPRKVRTPQEIRQVIKAQYDDVVRTSGKTDIPVIIDGGKGVPWREVMTVMDMAKLAGIRKIEFAAPIGYEIKQ